jgi:hypothetical protein
VTATATAIDTRQAQAEIAAAWQNYQKVTKYGQAQISPTRMRRT